ncbi:MAG: hypothetical protein JWP23_3586 [Phenylobacterium sp.]|nr:hypothetical protein [Phenylobacterium sp.]MDB5465197.1 hypothetical protein [Phenylobacterium sp.]
MRKFAFISAALGALSLASATNAAYTTTFQGATFTVVQVSSTEFTFDIAGANALTGDWAGATFLGAFAFNDIGSPTTLTATQIVPPGASTIDTPGGLNASGCDGSGTGFYCFNLTPNVAVAPDLKWDIVATGGTFNFASTGPTLKIDWTTSSTSDTHLGSLFSASIPPGGGGGVVPEPATWAMMVIGFGGLGAVLRSKRRRQRLAIA